jgi:hypothetical protein
MSIITGGEVLTGGEHLTDSGLGRPLAWDGVPANGVSEVQDVNDGDATAGDYKLQVLDQNGAVLGTTAVIPFNETAANVKIALDAIGGVTVTVTGTGSVAAPYVVTFTEPGGNLPLMLIVDDTTTGGAGAAVIANTAGVLGAFGNQVAVGGLVRNIASDDDVYENQGTSAIPSYARIDTLPA